MADLERPDMKRTHKDIIRDIFKQHGYVTNRMLCDVGISHTGRNRIREMGREEFAPNGQIIEFTAGEDFLDNKWTIKWIKPRAIPDPSGQLDFYKAEEANAQMTNLP